MVSGTGGTAAGETTIGTVTLPANGPWNIWGIWSLIAAVTPTAGEAIGGYIRMDSLDGDVQPNPAPTRFPTGLGGSWLGATQPVMIDRLKVWPIQLEAPGKARISLIYNQATTVTVATKVLAGLMYGKTRPIPVVFTYIDRVRAQVTAAAETLVGTVTLAEKARRITHVGCVMAQDGVLTTVEDLIASFRLGSNDINMPPSQWPPSAVFSGGLGAVIGQSEVVAPAMIPVDIPVPGGARVDCYIDLLDAVTNAAEVEIYIAYE